MLFPPFCYARPLFEYIVRLWFGCVQAKNTILQLSPVFACLRLVLYNDDMQPNRSTLLLTRLVAYVVLAYGLVIVLDALFRQLRIHHGRRLDLLLITVPQIAGLGFMYLGTLLLRRKYNAWLSAMALFGVTLLLDLWHLAAQPKAYDTDGPPHILLPILIMLVLWLARGAFKVRSDLRTFQQALWVTVLVLAVAFLYGMVGFSLLDDHDFHHEMSVLTAAHQTIDQFGLTTDHPVASTRRARLFLDSLSVISLAAVGYAVISFFEPIRVRLIHQPSQRELCERLLREYPSDIDDFFKLWPHDKHYYFDKRNEAGLCYHVTRGVALVVGNPFGNPKQFGELVDDFMELCFVNDWMPVFVHVDGQYRKLYEARRFRLQKIGEEAVLNITEFEDTSRDKYFRQIRNRFVKLGYSVSVEPAPHDDVVMGRLKAITTEWLRRPGKAERGFMLGYFDDAYLQMSSLALLYDADHHVQGFLNLVPTFEGSAANYDLLRCSNDAPGNANDFLLLGLIEHLRGEGIDRLNLGLCPLAGVDSPDSEETTLVDQALRFVYANGDRFYSFSGLRRFKSKYNPAWEPRYIVYPGGVRNFTRAIYALNRAMRVK